MFVEVVGFEPMTSCMPCKRSSQLSYTPVFSVSKYKSSWGNYAILWLYFFQIFIRREGR